MIADQLDDMIERADEMLRNRADIARLREDLLDAERAADKARLAITTLQRRQLELASAQAGVTP
ncbi:MAG: hypothetical protein IT480_12795 [Gammaproteobacteria bacterium]|nr:hypothetical protein [Gammaproteobacteria bacterium]